MRGILIDLDNTLLDDSHATAEGFRKFYSVSEPASSPADFDAAFMRWKAILERNWQRFENGEITFQEQRRCRVRDFLAEELDDAAADTAYRSYQQGYESAWRLLPGVAEFLEMTRGVPKVIVTNGERDAQWRKVRSTALDTHVVGVVTPTDCGHWKPSPVIFQAALAILNLPATDCLMIGDDAERDIEPAKRLGMRCFHARPGLRLDDVVRGASQSDASA